MMTVPTNIYIVKSNYHYVYKVKSEKSKGSGFELAFCEPQNGCAAYMKIKT